MTTDVELRRIPRNPYELALWLLVAVAIALAVVFWIVVQVQSALVTADLQLLQTKDQLNVGIPEGGYAPVIAPWARPFAAMAPALLAFGMLLATALLFVRMLRWRAPR